MYDITLENFQSMNIGPNKIKDVQLELPSLYAEEKGNVKRYGNSHNGEERKQSESQSPWWPVPNLRGGIFPL